MSDKPFAKLRELLVEWQDLEVQATNERSHYYVRGVARQSAMELPKLLEALDKSLVAYEQFIDCMEVINEHLGYKFSQPLIAAREALNELKLTN